MSVEKDGLKEIHAPAVSLREEFNAGTAMWQVVVGWLAGWLSLHVALTRMTANVDWKYTVDSNARNPLAVIIPSVLVALIVRCRWACTVGSRYESYECATHVQVCNIRSDLWGALSLSLSLH